MRLESAFRVASSPYRCSYNGKVVLTGTQLKIAALRLFSFIFGSDQAGDLPEPFVTEFRIHINFLCFITFRVNWRYLSPPNYVLGERKHTTIV